MMDKETKCNETNLCGDITNVIRNFNAMLFVLQYDPNEQNKFIPAMKIQTVDDRVLFSIFVGVVQNDDYEKDLSIVLIPYNSNNAIFLGQISLDRDTNKNNFENMTDYDGKKLKFDNYKFRQNFKFNYNIPLNRKGEYAVVLVNGSHDDIIKDIDMIKSNALSIYYFEIE